MNVLRKSFFSSIRKSEKNFYGNINVKDVNGKKKFWKTIKPLFSNEGLKSNILKAESHVWDNFCQVKALKKWRKMFFLNFTFKGLFVLKIFEFLSWSFGHIDD